MTVIYKISSIIKPERIYIGSAVNYYGRKAVHLSQLSNNKHGNNKLQRHFNKYGNCDLVFSIVENVPSRNDLLKREQYYIDTLSPYFNICTTAGSNLGRVFGPMTEERKIKISKQRLGTKNPKASDSLSKGVLKYDLNGNLITKYKNLSEAKKNEGVVVRFSTATNLTIGGFVWVSPKSSLPNFEEIRNRVSNCRKAKNMAVIQINKDGKVLKEFEGVRMAGRETGIDHRSIQSVASGKHPSRKTAGGFVWRYKKVA